MKKKSKLEKLTYVVVWIMIISTIGGVIFGSMYSLGIFGG